MPLVVAHIAAVDLASYGDTLYPLVAANELSRRLDGVQVVPFGPVGASGAGPTATTWALGSWSESRAGEIAQRATVTLCGGGEIVQGDGTTYGPFYGLDPRDALELGIDRWFIEGLGAAEQTCPLIWNAPGVPNELDPATAERVREALLRRAVVAVRDDRSRRLLEAAGVDRDISVVPDSALVLPRVLAVGDLARRHDRLRRDGVVPPNGPTVVVQGNNTMSGLAPALAEALDALAPELHVVTVGISPCHDDHRFAEAVRGRLARPSWALPESAPLEDIAALIAGADCFLGVSLHGAITALTYGRPFVTLDPFSQAKLEGFVDLIGWPEARTGDPTEAARLTRRRARGDDRAPDVLGALQARIDDHFDRIAEVATRVASRQLMPLTWADTAPPLHLVLRRPPRPLTPVASTPAPGVRYPDVSPTPHELQVALDRALATRAGQRAETAGEHAELARLREENHHLRGAIAHLEGVAASAAPLVESNRQSEAKWVRVESELTTLAAERDRLARIIQGARASRVYRVTRLPRALRPPADGAGDPRHT